MYTIAIDDPNIYQAGEIFASENHSSLKEMVNKYVAELVAKGECKLNCVKLLLL